MLFAQINELHDKFVRCFRIENLTGLNNWFNESFFIKTIWEKLRLQANATELIISHIFLANSLSNIATRIHLNSRKVSRHFKLNSRLRIKKPSRWSIRTISIITNKIVI